MDPTSMASAEYYQSAGFLSTARKAICVGRTSFVVDDGGALYTSRSGTPDQWSLYRRDAAVFTLSNTSFFVITTEGRITSDSYYSDAPLGWMASREDGALQPECVVTAIANAGSRILFTTADGRLYTFAPAATSRRWSPEQG